MVNISASNIAPSMLFTIRFHVNCLAAFGRFEHLLVKYAKKYIAVNLSY